MSGPSRAAPAPAPKPNARRRKPPNAHPARRPAKPAAQANRLLLLRGEKFELVDADASGRLGRADGRGGRLADPQHDEAVRRLGGLLDGGRGVRAAEPD